MADAPRPTYNFRIRDEPAKGAKQPARPVEPPAGLEGLRAVAPMEGAVKGPAAVLVVHGMGQEVAFETIGGIVKGLAKGPPPAEPRGEKGSPPDVTWSVAETREVSATPVGGSILRHADLTLEGEVGDGTGPRAKAQRVVHVHEAYWAPLTEGKVSLRDVMSFMVSGGLNGARNGGKTFYRMVFRKTRGYAPPRGTTLVLLVALGTVAALAAMNAVAAAVLAAKLLPGADVTRPLTYGLFAFLLLAALLGLHVGLALAARARARGNPGARAGLKVRRDAGMTAFAWALGGALGVLVGTAALVLHGLIRLAPGVPDAPFLFAALPATRVAAFGAVALVVAVVGLAAAGRIAPALIVAAAGLAVAAFAALVGLAGVPFSRAAQEVGVGVLALLLVVGALALLQAKGGWPPPKAEGEKETLRRAKVKAGKPEARFRTAEPPKEDRERVVAYRWFQGNLLASLLATSLLLAFPGLKVPWPRGVLGLGAIVAVLGALVTVACLVPLARKGGWRALDASIAALLVTGLAAYGLSWAPLQPPAPQGASPAQETSPAFAALVLGAWALVLVVSLFVRRFLVQFMGDVAAYVSPHTLDKFNDLRESIKSAVRKAAEGVYDAKDEKGAPLYRDVVVVAHSLGSVAAYDALNALLLEDLTRDEASRRDVAGRTRALVTFGSPLDRTAFVFSTQTEGQRDYERSGTDPRDALSALGQPLRNDAAARDAIPWVNLHSDADVISSALTYYDPPAGDEEGASRRRVVNVEDPDATTPLAAHTEYWENPLLWRHVVHALLTPKEEIPPRG